jgi:hypothetical protein
MTHRRSSASTSFQRTTTSRAAACLLLSAFCLLPFSGCKPKNFSAPVPGANLRMHPDDLAKPPRDKDPRRYLYAQVCEDDRPNQFAESAIIEGAPYKYLLRSLVNVSHDDLRKHTDKDATFQSLLDRPGMYRGRVHTLARGVIIEVSKAEAPPEYGLPPGYTILPAIFIDSTRDLYALRILCPPGSNCYERLDEGIRKDQLPVLRISGYFLKNYARKTADANEPPWRRPLLVCAEPEFSQGIPPRKVMDELEQSGALRFMPSARIEAPGAEERIVLELAPGNRVLLDGEEISGDLREAAAARLYEFKKRLPADQRSTPAAVILVSPGANRSLEDGAIDALRWAGVKRISLKIEK